MKHKALAFHNICVWGVLVETSSSDFDRAHGWSIKTSWEGNKVESFIDNRTLSNMPKEKPEGESTVHLVYL